MSKVLQGQLKYVQMANMSIYVARNQLNVSMKIGKEWSRKIWHQTNWLIPYVGKKQYKRGKMLILKSRQKKNH